VFGEFSKIQMANVKELQACAKFRFLLGKTAAITVTMLKEDFKDEAYGKTQVYEWFNHCKRGEISVEDQPRCGRLP